jgi:hypothetical protein
MSIPKWASQEIESLRNENERLKKSKQALIDQKALVSRELEIAQEGWTDEQKDECRRQAIQQ